MRYYNIFFSICKYLKRKRKKDSSSRYENGRQHIRHTNPLTPHEINPYAENKYRADKRYIVLRLLGDYGRYQLREQGYRALEYDHGQCREYAALAH